MKDAEDEAFDDLERRQGGFQAKRAMAADKQELWNEDEWRRNNWRCHHGWLRGEQCEICNAPQPAQEPTSGDYALGYAEGFNDACKKPAQEPVGYVYSEKSVKHGAIERDLPNGTPLYAASPQREWVGLTDDELADLWYKESLDWMEFARAHEAALKEKNFD
jgi:hypothetical protein